MVYSRTGKPIPNAHVQKLFGHLHGADGELVVGEPNAPDVYRKTQSGVMSAEGEPDVYFMMFDFWTRKGGYDPYGEWHSRGRASWVTQHMVETVKDVEYYETQHLSEGYEGIMLRDPRMPYVFGRTHMLMKLKRFSDSEAVILGMEERRSNDGQPLGTLGALQVRDVHSGIEFSLGSGFSDAERAGYWAMQDKANGLLVKYKFFDKGAKDKPRFPVFIGARSAMDVERLRLRQFFPAGVN